jgi:hypothetical protein
VNESALETRQPAAGTQRSDLSSINRILDTIKSVPVFIPHSIKAATCSDRGAAVNYPFEVTVAPQSQKIHANLISSRAATAGSGTC